MKKTLGRQRHRLEDDIRMDLKEMGFRIWIEFKWRWIGTIGGIL
jgi:hypothetical protein